MPYRVAHSTIATIVVVALSSAAYGDLFTPGLSMWKFDGVEYDTHAAACEAALEQRGGASYCGEGDVYGTYYLYPSVYFVRFLGCKFTSLPNYPVCADHGSASAYRDAVCPAGHTAAFTGRIPPDPEVACSGPPCPANTTWDSKLGCVNRASKNLGRCSEAAN